MRPPKPDGIPAEHASDEQRIRATAVALLARREHSRHELLTKLVRRGYDEAACERVVEDLAGRALVSDRRFVESFLAHRSGRGQGPVRIRAELRERGVDSSAIEDAIDSAEVHWTALAASVRRRRFGAALPKDFAARAKQARFLQYRGFTQDQIRAAMGGEDDES